MGMCVGGFVAMPRVGSMGNPPAAHFLSSLLFFVCLRVLRVFVVCGKL
jgi:hypothetical protein